MWVLVGLGNPGRRYARTRHNVGFRVLDRLVERWGVTFDRKAHQAYLCDVRRDGERVLMMKPQTFMNLSGAAVGSLRRFYRFDAQHVIAIHDDVDLPVGRLRIRVGGRAGGNRGIASLIEALGSDAFIRLKVGVGRPPQGPVDETYVLGTPTGTEAGVLTAAEERAVEAVEFVLAEGAAPAMNRINQKEATHGGSPL